MRFLSNNVKKIVQPLLLVLSVLALYGQFLWNPIVFDDLQYFMVDQHGNMPVASMQWAPFQIRSLPYATLAWSKAWFGLDLIYFRVENLALHAMVVLALYFFLCRLFQTVLPDRDGGWQRMAFFAALLFGLHPVAVYAAGYLIQRSIVMATLFGLLSLWAYLEGMARTRSSLLWLSVFFYYCAVYSKEHAIMLPVVMVMMTVLLQKNWPERLKKNWAVLLGLLAIAGSVIFIKFGVFGSVYEVAAPEILNEPEQKSPYIFSVLTQSWLFFKYAGLWLFPNPDWMSVDMREPFADEIFSGYLLALLLFVLWGGAALFLLRKRGVIGLLGFSLLFPWLMFMPEFSVVRIQEIFVLYRSYLWAVGACAVLPVLFYKLNEKVAALILGVTALAMFSISMERLVTFSHPLLLWEDAEKLVKDHQELPGIYRIYYNRGNELYKMDQYDQAVADFRHAIKLRPDFAAAYQNLGAAYLKQREWIAAIGAFDNVLRLMQEKGVPLIDARPYYGRAQAYEGNGDMPHAIADYRLSCKYGNRGCEKVSGRLSE